MREKEGLGLQFIIQVDTLCHRIPNVVEKAARAGCNRVFIGLENINPDNLLQAKKKQNRVHEYRQVFLAWRARRSSPMPAISSVFRATRRSGLPATSAPCSSNCQSIYSNSLF